MAKNIKKVTFDKPCIVSVCSSKNKGESKVPVDRGELIENLGLKGDAHANADSTRQVSLLAIESIEKFNSGGFSFGPGDFAENFTTGGIDLVSLPIGTRLKIGSNAVVEITQIGKKCHSDCAIFRQIGKCVMPREGVFARVITGGSVKKGDLLEII
jgi:MOSC domain-containing protein YiiM